ncbi:MAG: helix-turn-helix domain-containing protein, partial [Clostridia bacterium]
MADARRAKPSLVIMGMWGAGMMRKFCNITIPSESFRMLSDPYSELLKECCVHQLLCRVYRMYNRRRSNAYQVGGGERTDEQRLVYDITHDVDMHIGNLDSLAMRSEKFCYNDTYIVNAFSQQMRETLFSYDSRRRFEKARDDMMQGVGITDIASLLGYPSIHAFSRAFENFMGICPSTYQEEF